MLFPLCPPQGNCGLQPQVGVLYDNPDPALRWTLILSRWPLILIAQAYPKIGPIRTLGDLSMRAMDGLPEIQVSAPLGLTTTATGIKMQPMREKPTSLETFALCSCGQRKELRLSVE